MARKIKRVAVVGAGVMGTGIAAHAAGVGLDTVLLDIVPPGLSPEERERRNERNRFAVSAIARAKKSKPPTFYNVEDADRITVGNLDDDLRHLESCDWVIEAIIENLEIKRSLFSRIEQHRQPGAIVTSNTSGLKIADMVQGRSDDFIRHFFVTHFFNPPRFMRLLELVAGEGTDPDVFAQMARFGSERLGKGIVFAKDTPNFIANRIGTFGMMYTLEAMQREGMSIEEIDAVFGTVTGRPKSAIFRTADIVGLDTLVHVANNCFENLTEDPHRDVFKVPEFVTRMVDRGWLGAKTKGGFYKKEGGEILALDPNSFEYKPKQKVRAPSIGAVKGIEQVGPRIRALVANTDDPLARLAWDVTARTLTYSAERLGEIADDVVNIDNALKWGFNWELGPFETWDALGVPESVERMSKEGYEVPALVRGMLDRNVTSFYGGTLSRPTYYHFQLDAEPGAGEEQAVPVDERQVRLGALREQDQIIKKNSSATLFDIGDGVLLVEFHTKLNAVDDGVIAMLDEAISIAEDNGHAGVVLGNEHKDAFSAGANLFAVAMAINGKQWEPLEKMVAAFQQATTRLRYSDVPVVAAPAGLALGGGAEMVMGADAVQAHAETYMGLVEVGVGLIPGGGGTWQMLERHMASAPDDADFDPLPMIRGAFMNIAMARVSIGAEEARTLGMLRGHDGVTLNRDLLLHDAKQRVLGMSRAGYRPPRPVRLRLPGKSAATTIQWFADNMRQGRQISDHDYLIASKLANVLCGGDTSRRVKVDQQQVLDLEREAFLSLCGEQKTKERIEHMLMKNKPLRN